MTAARLHYELAVTHPQDHVVEVAVRVDAPGDTLDLCMAAWSPGSYLIRDYARYVHDLRADDGLRAEKLDKHTWRIACAGRDAVTVRYAVYGHELTVRTNHIDATHAFLHGPAVYLFPPDRLADACDVTVRAPAGWRVATGLRRAGDGYAAAGVDELLDCPLHVAPGEPRAFHAAGKPARLALWGEIDPGGVATVDDLVRDVAAIMDAHAARFGGAPYDDYTFQLMLSPGAYGGLEHGNSSANLNHPFALATRKSYESLLELLSHEYFHVWNGKRIRPAALGPFDYAREAYTRSLWVQEGITSYVDRYTVRRAGCMSARAYLEKLADEWGKLLAIPGRLRHSLEESSFDAWIKLYKPDESNTNTTVSYYHKGGLVALALDLELRAQTAGQRTLDDALRALWDHYGAAERGYDDGDVQPLFEQATGASLGAFFDRHVRGTEDPDLAGALATVGLAVEADREPAKDAGAPPPAWLGVTLAGARVATVLDGSPAHRAGLAPGDELVAADRYRAATDADLRARLAARGAAGSLTLTVFRRDRLVEVPVLLEPAPPNRFTIRGLAEPGDDARARYREWMGEPHPGAELEVRATVSTWL